MGLNSGEAPGDYIEQFTEGYSLDQTYYERQLESLNRYAVRFNNASSLREVSLILDEIILRVLNQENSFFGIIEDNFFKIIYPDRAETRNIPLHENSLIKKTVERLSVQWISDTSTDETYSIISENGNLNIQSVIAVPILNRMNILALVVIESFLVNDFMAQDMNILSLLADYVATTIKRLEYSRSMNNINEDVSKETINDLQKITQRFSHDLRGPLQTINNSAYMLRRSNPEKVNLVRMIELSVETCKSLINEMQNQTQALKVKPVVTDVIDLIEKTLKLVPMNDNVQVLRVYHDDYIIWKLDQKKMKQVFLNLIQNSVEAMPNGGKLIIQVKKLENKLEIEITDTGVGIPEDLKKQLFKPFFTTKKNSIGLGLLHSKNVVEAHNGELSLESQENEGTLIRIKIPLSQ